jgi:peptidoglycan/xylan/chitin deacetylase (PgdA/CDA1 family)
MWPDDKRCAVALTFDLDGESVWIDENPDNANKPGVLSQGRYGPRVGVPLILDLLKYESLTATFFIVGKVAEDHPEAIRAIAAHGHELAIHGYTHKSPSAQTRKEEDQSIARTLAILEPYRPSIAGYRSPSGDFSQNTLELLGHHGLSYSSNMMDDIRPYIHPGTSIVELPIQWILDDGAHFWFSLEAWDKKISTPSEVLEIWETEFEGIYELGGSFILTMHPQITGRPSRLKLLRDFVGFVKSHDGVWFATCAEIADQARRHLTQPMR